MPAEERRPAEKAAAVISILGSERASEVFRYLTENEVEQLSMEITRLPRLAEDELEDIAKDFYNYTAFCFECDAQRGTCST